jgi:hypothetical protein
MSKVVPTSTGGMLGVAEAGTVLSWGRAGSAYYWRRSKSLINRQLINGAALVGRPCFFHRADVPLWQVVLDDHEGGDQGKEKEDQCELLHTGCSGQRVLNTVFPIGNGEDLHERHWPDNPCRSTPGANVGKLQS